MHRIKKISRYFFVFLGIIYIRGKTSIILNGEDF